MVRKELYIGGRRFLQISVRVRHQFASSWGGGEEGLPPDGGESGRFGGGSGVGEAFGRGSSGMS